MIFHITPDITMQYLLHSWKLAAQLKTESVFEMHKMQ